MRLIREDGMIERWSHDGDKGGSPRVGAARGYLPDGERKWRPGDTLDPWETHGPECVAAT